MTTFSPQEIYIIDNDGQTDIELSHPYVVGAGEIMVFLNGILCVIDKDYTEVDEQHIHFTFHLSVDDAIVIQHRMFFSDKNISVIGKAGRSLFQTLGTETTLLPNQEYKMSFTHGTQVVNTKFHSIIDPFYSTIQIIKSDLGDIVDDIETSRLLFLIYQDSILSQNIASEENLALLESEAKVPYVFKQFVRYRVELDIMSAVYMAVTGRMGSSKKMLGEFSVERRSDLGQVDITIILGDLKGKLKEWEKLLRGGTLVSPLGSAVRGGATNAYPLKSPRRF